MKKLTANDKRAIIVLALLAISVIIGFYVYSAGLFVVPFAKRSDKFANYKCYDLNLEFESRSEEIYVVWDIAYEYEDESYNEYIAYQKIVNAPSDQFIAYRLSGWMVGQNPEKYVDVRRDWNVKQVSISCDKAHVDHNSAAIKYACYALYNGFDSGKNPPDKTVWGVAPYKTYKVTVRFSECRGIKLVLKAMVFETSIGQEIRLCIWNNYVPGSHGVCEQTNTEPIYVWLEHDNELYKQISLFHNEMLTDSAQNK